MKLRESNIDRLDRRTFDVLIVGGGINGAVSASALSSMGASVALIDRGDFASQTSQHSSNLIWGGVKYLESYELGLVRKLCRGRNHLLESYPANVQEIRFLATLERGFRVGRVMLWLGTLLYWLIGLFKTRRPEVLRARDVKAREPAVDVSRSAGGVEYSDAYLVDNDARFVWRFVRAALDHGGIAANHVEAIGAERQGDVWVTRARDHMTGREITIRSRVVVNACGPWVGPVNGLYGAHTRHQHLLSKGVHLVVEPVSEARRVLAFFADDGRLFFVIPMGAKACIGTTDTRVDDPEPAVTPEDRRFILANANRMLDLKRPLTEADIISERCGVRPLVVSRAGGPEDTGDWTSLSRKHEVEVDATRAYVAIFGGKLTDCVNVGEEVAEAVYHLGVKLPWRGVRWYGEPPDEVREEFFHQARLMGLDEMTRAGAWEPLSTRFWRRYGARADELLEAIRQDPRMAEPLIEGTEYVRAELHHAARCEMVTTLEDFMRRRSKISMVMRHEDVVRAPGLFEACQILFGDQARAKLDEYLAEEGGPPPRTAEEPAEAAAAAG